MRNGSAAGLENGSAAGLLPPAYAGPAGWSVFVVVTCWVLIFPGPTGSRAAPRPWLCVIVVLGIALFEVGQLSPAKLNWVSVLAIAAAVCGRFTVILRPALLGAAALAQGDTPLTEREEVLAAAAGHDTIAVIAAQLHLSPGTVRNHLSSAIQKLGARNRAEALQIAQRKGWL